MAALSRTPASKPSAAPTTGMTHLAIQEHLNGKVVEWMEKVTDEQYAGTASAYRCARLETR